MFLGYDFTFWISVISASFVKWVLSPQHSIWRAFATGFVGIWAAWTFTIPFVDYMGWDSSTYTIGVAGTLALTGDGLARIAIAVTHDPQSLTNFFKEILSVWKERK